MSDDPQIETILERLVVSHDWMVPRFVAVMDRLPPDIRLLLRSVTAIVISTDIRPSYFSFGTGAIYLDPANLWLTAGERDTVPTTPDFRSSFGNDLAFLSLWRYVQNNNYAWSTNLSAPRSLDDIEPRFAALMYHELAHAVDFFPPDQLFRVSMNLSAYQAGVFLEPWRLSQDLHAFRPLSSTLLKSLAQVMYFGAQASADQRSLQPSDIAAQFSADGASDDYAYATIYEDFAMLVEEVMMSHHYGVQRDVAYTNSPPAGSPRSAYVVAWGMRSRAAEPWVRERAEYALERLLTSADVSDYFSTLPAHRLLDTGVSWDQAIWVQNGPLAGKINESDAQGTDVFDANEQKPYRIFDGSPDFFNPSSE